MLRDAIRRGVNTARISSRAHRRDREQQEKRDGGMPGAEMTRAGEYEAISWRPWIAPAHTAHEGAIESSTSPCKSRRGPTMPRRPR